MIYLPDSKPLNDDVLMEVLNRMTLKPKPPFMCLGFTKSNEKFDNMFAGKAPNNRLEINVWYTSNLRTNFFKHTKSMPQLSVYIWINMRNSKHMNGNQRSVQRNRYSRALTFIKVCSTEFLLAPILLHKPDIFFLYTCILLMTVQTIIVSRNIKNTSTCYICMARSIVDPKRNA